MRLRRLLGGLALCLALSPATTRAEAPAPGDATLTVGTKVAPPFVVKRPDGSFDGPSIRLWREIASDLDLQFRFEERDLPGLLRGLQDGTLDVSVAAITVTAERERDVDFSHPFHTAGLAIAVRPERVSVWRTVAGVLLSRSVLQLIAAIALLQLLVGTLVWFLERRRNPNQFGGSTGQGIFAGFWWSTVTMTTVGYGDKAPKTVAGRVVALAWMLCSVIMVATFTAAAASQLTVSRLETGIDGPSDLVRAKVAVVANTTGEGYSRNAGLSFSRYADPSAALDALAAGTVDAVVHDGPVLTELAPAYPGLEVVDVRFQRQDYAIAFPEGSELRERVNRILPEKVRSTSVVDATVIP